MKTVFTIIILLFGVSMLRAQWFTVYSPSYAQSSYVLKFYDNNTGYYSTVLYNGSLLNIYKTTNGGVSWAAQSSGYTAQRFMAIYIIHPDTVLISGNYGKILRTYNGGTNWNLVYADTTKQFWGLQFVNSSTGYVAGSSGTILKTIDIGTTWQPLNSGVMNAMQSVHFLNLNTGYISGSAIVLKTTDAGNTFVNMNAPYISGFESFTDIYFTNLRTGWFSTNAGRIVKTTDGGTSWNVVYNESGTGIWGLSFTDSLTGYACNSVGKILKTTNGGTTWGFQNTPVSENLYDIHFPSSQTGFVACWSGKVLKTTNGGATFINGQIEDAHNFYLKQNYPNPFNPETSLEFSVKTNSYITLSVYNLLGKEILKINDRKFHSSGIYKSIINLNNSPSGTYFLRIMATDKNNQTIYQETKTMILLK